MAIISLIKIYMIIITIINLDFYYLIFYICPTILIKAVDVAPSMKKKYFDHL
jgi:hypothetical protein